MREGPSPYSPTYNGRSLRDSDVFELEIASIDRNRDLKSCIEAIVERRPNRSEPSSGLIASAQKSGV